MIYLDNAATTPYKPQCVIDAVAAAMSGMGNADRGAHGSALRSSRSIYEARVKTAAFFGCTKADRVVFTANSTEALNTVLSGVFRRGDHVITTELEHNSVLRPLYRLRQAGEIALDFLPADAWGNPVYGALEDLLRADTRAVVCTHASNLTGNAVDLARISAFTKAHGLLLIVDAAQTAGVFPISMEEMGIDVLCFTGHKALMGPQGTGGLCIREGVEIRPWKVGGSGIYSYDEEHPKAYPSRLEAGTLNGHGIAGLSAAIDFLNEMGLDVIREKERRLMRQFYEGVSRVEGVRIYGDFSTEERAAIVALNIRAYDSAAVADALYEDYGIAVRAGAHCAPRMHMALGTKEQGAVRFSFSWMNTEEEVECAVRAVTELARE